MNACRPSMRAYELADLGRKKNAPEYLVTAAGILHRLSSIKDLQEIKPLDETGDQGGRRRQSAIDEEIKAPAAAGNPTNCSRRPATWG